MSGDDLTRIEPWLAALLANLTPGKRRTLARKIGQRLRRENAARIAANIEPDGGKMEPRKPRRGRSDGRVRKKGRMFRKIALARNLKIDASPDQVAIQFLGSVRRTAEVHHFGKRDRVARFRGAPEAQYAARRLLGFGADDPDAVMEAALDHLGGPFDR